MAKLTADTIISDHSALTGVNTPSFSTDKDLDRGNNVLLAGGNGAQNTAVYTTSQLLTPSATDCGVACIVNLRGNGTFIHAVDTSGDTVFKFEIVGATYQISFGAGVNQNRLDLTNTHLSNQIKGSSDGEIGLRRLLFFGFDGNRGSTGNSRIQMWDLDGGTASQVTGGTSGANGGTTIGTIDRVYFGNNNTQTSGQYGKVGRSWWFANQITNGNEKDTLEGILTDIAYTVQEQTADATNGVTWIHDTSSTGLPGSLTAAGGPTYTNDDQGIPAMDGDGTDNELFGTGVGTNAVEMTILSKMDFDTPVNGKYQDVISQQNSTGGAQDDDHYFIRVYAPDDPTIPNGFHVIANDGSLGGSTTTRISTDVTALTWPVIAARFCIHHCDAFVNATYPSFQVMDQQAGGGATKLGNGVARNVKLGNLDGVASTWFDDGRLGGAFCITEECLSELQVYVKTQNINGVTYSAPTPPATGGDDPSGRGTFRRNLIGSRDLAFRKVR